MSDKRVELADMQMVKSYANDLRDTLDDGSLSDRRAFIRSFVQEITVTKHEIQLNYTLPLLSDGLTEERMGVLPIVRYGGPSDSIAQLKIKTFFEVSLVSTE